MISPSSRLGLSRPVEKPSSSGSPSKQRTLSSESGGRCLNSADGVGGNRVWGSAEWDDWASASAQEDVLTHGRWVILMHLRLLLEEGTYRSCLKHVGMHLISMLVEQPALHAGHRFFDPDFLIPGQEDVPNMYSNHGRSSYAEAVTTRRPDVIMGFHRRA